MRRRSKSRAPKFSADSQRLIAIAQAMNQAGSRFEERAWERQLDLLIRKLLKHDHQNTIDTALDHLFSGESGAYDTLMESVEAVSSSCVVEHDGERHDAMLIAMPILAWTRFSIASGPISADMLSTLTAHLYGHILASGTKVAMAPTLYAIDQLPRSHTETYKLTERMAQAALGGAALRPLVNAPETAPFLADTRYLLALVITSADGPFFQWQTSDVPLDVMVRQQQALAQWRSQALPNIERLLPGCGIELLLPEAYFVACREADKQIRPVSVHAAVHYLTHTLGIEASGLTAIIGGFGEEVQDDIEEYRISFTLRDQPDVVYGIVWPLYGQEESDEPGTDVTVGRSVVPLLGELPISSPLEEIVAMLRASGVTDLKQHDERFPLEFCEDCGSPLFCDRDAELVHAEMPEDATQTSGHLH
ncbi:MAG: hypothetical protein JWQ23_2202 [Herminiimonas sp.]|nr:hypothetical protein [Herminiimonas sp.]